MKVVAGVAVLAALLAGQAVAADKAYVELAVGQSTVEDWCDNDEKCDDGDTSFRLLVGTALTDNISVDLSYTDFGDVSASDTTYYDVSAQASALALQLGIHAPVGKGAIFAKGGFAYTKVEVQGYNNLYFMGSQYKYAFSEEDSSMKPVLAFGFKAPVSDRAAIVGQVERILKAGDDETTGESDITNLSLGLRIEL